MPRLSLVLVTRDDAQVLGACLSALGLQRAAGFEVVVVDTGSSDGTVDLVRDRRRGLPFPVRLLSAGPMPLRLALDLGVALARAPLVVLVRPDAAPGPDWVDQALATLAAADLAFRPAGPRRRRPPVRRARPPRPARRGRAGARARRRQVRGEPDGTRVLFLKDHPLGAGKAGHAHEGQGAHRR